MNKAVMRGIALVGVGALAGGIASAATSASAAPTTTATTSATTTGNSGTGGSSPSASTSTSAVPGGGQGQGAPPGAALPLHGTITTVGTASVTIKTSSDTVSYAVTSSSTIDKHGKATLSALAVGDTVAFSTVTTDGTTAIDTLVAGMAGGCGPGGSVTGHPNLGQGAPPGAPSTSGPSSTNDSSGSSGSSTSGPSA